MPAWCWPTLSCSGTQVLLTTGVVEEQSRPLLLLDHEPSCAWGRGRRKCSRDGASRESRAVGAGGVPGSLLATRCQNSRFRKQAPTRHNLAHQTPKTVVGSGLITGLDEWLGMRFFSIRTSQVAQPAG